MSGLERRLWALRTPEDQQIDLHILVIWNALHREVGNLSQLIVTAPAFERSHADVSDVPRIQLPFFYLEVSGLHDLQCGNAYLSPYRLDAYGMTDCRIRVETEHSPLSVVRTFGTTRGVD